ncbi:hypothetical protein TUM20985_25000 [Mycobacterium antarcticum]|uniref:hypothetical protein n=1 Tax=unclassified Mycolicibacterium TaxID=2636767 RepID=UPI0023975251|nr:MULTISPECIES: hypothetical protein [unclassified Mycolicibacterium]BDX31953.1 hypothetical protein TUM20985_25000 [Mycolicibacterium sp. TUM20985]GLP81044.1 hypothetical protein TUM20984_24640 [Mycolicibacterium sp. TUM20984]
MSIRRTALAVVWVGAVVIGGAGTAGAAPPPPTPQQDSAEWTVTDGYFVKQIACTPDTPGDPVAITWDAPGFIPWLGGTGMIHDANPQLGGQFSTHWVPVPGYWDVAYEFC